MTIFSPTLMRAFDLMYFGCFVKVGGLKKAENLCFLHLDTNELGRQSLENIPLQVALDISQGCRAHSFSEERLLHYGRQLP